MYSEQLPYRQLYDAILEYEGEALYDDVLRPWLDRHDGERRWLETIRDRPGQPVPPMQPEESCRLYALSRIVDLLQLSFAPDGADGGWKVAAVRADEFAAFMAALGLERVEHDRFHPFYHEVVTLDEAADEDASPRVTRTYWPAHMLGPLLISRAGCGVEAGRRHMRKEIAERSTLYWAYARNHRRTEDLSLGWGSNSQWATAFRRDYRLGGAFHYNVDANPNPAFADEELGAHEAVELLRHRCFVASTLPDADRWPYDLKLVEPI